MARIEPIKVEVDLSNVTDEVLDQLADLLWERIADRINDPGRLPAAWSGIH